MYDAIVSNVKIYDGSGRLPFYADVAVSDGRIAAVGTGINDAGAPVIDAGGASMCPGFIDAHSHGDLVIGDAAAAAAKLSQGVTTEIAGQCGLSMFPIAEQRAGEAKNLLSIGTDHFPDALGTFCGFSKFKEYAESIPLPLNLSVFVGHSALRLTVMGEEDRRPTPAELEGMQRLLAEAMMQGALGLSSGLIYPPGAFARKEELKALCEVVAKYNGIYTTHMRNESKHVVEAVKEAVGIARETGAALNISHIKVMGMDNWGLSERILEEIEAARRDGVSVTMDLYPYKATSTMLNVCIPPQFFKDGRKKLLERLADKSFRAELKAAISDPDQEYDNNYISCRGFENILVAKARKSPAAEGRRIAEYAAEKGVDPFDLYFDLLMENELEGAAVYFCIGEDDISNFIRDPLCVIGTDGICLGSGGAGHPRAFGTFPHAIEWFVKDKRLFSMSEMIYKMTGKTAEIYGLAGKGFIRPGMDADFILFDEDKLHATADYAHANSLTDGIHSVWIRGEKVYEDKSFTKKFKGQLLLRES